LIELELDFWGISKPEPDEKMSADTFEKLKDIFSKVPTDAS